MGARFLEKENGGRGILLAGAPGTPSAQVLVLGSGNVGLQSTAIALGMGARVLVADHNLEALRRAELRFGFRVQTLFATYQTISEALTTTDLVICAALTVGAKAPKLITRSMLQTMLAGSVIVDVAIDQGGCCETSHPTSHSQPVYTVDGVIHYCVTNMPGIVPRTSTIALSNATLPFIIALANKGWRKALREDPCLSSGLEITAGNLISAPVAAAHGLPLSNLMPF
jgi:alanine dehydrogenase